VGNQIDSIEKSVEHLLDYLSFSDQNVEPPMHICTRDNHPNAGWAKVGLRHFDNAEAFAADVETLGGLTKTYDRQFFHHDDVAPNDLNWDWDTCYMTNRIGDFSSALTKQPLYGLVRVRKVPLQKVRGLFRVTTGTVAERSTALIFGDGQYTTTREYIQYAGRRQWDACWQGAPIIAERLDEEHRVHVQMAMSMALTSFYDWKVELRFHENLPSVSLVTDPVGCREIFRLRDAPSGGTRRAALRNWVSQHYRQARREPYNESLVREHLRGATEFVWNGMWAKITPSMHDIQKATKGNRRG
jgi:hypothetical protein